VVKDHNNRKLDLNRINATIFKEGQKMSKMDLPKESQGKKERKREQDKFKQI